MTIKNEKNSKLTLILHHLVQKISTSYLDKLCTPFHKRKFGCFPHTDQGADICCPTQTRRGKATEIFPQTNVNPFISKNKRKFLTISKKRKRIQSEGNTIDHS